MKHNEALLKAEKFQQKMETIAQNDYWRPQYHIAAPANWINDPNGFCFIKVNIIYSINITHILANGVLCIGVM